MAKYERQKHQYDLIVSFKQKFTVKRMEGL